MRVSLLGLASIAASPAVPTQGLPKQDGQCSTLIETQALLTLPLVRAFVARATTTPSADFCRAVRATSRCPQSRIRDTRQISRDKLDHLPRATAGFTTSALDGYGLRDHLLARP